jgi:GTPase SAR1 family protein
MKTEIEMRAQVKEFNKNYATMDKSKISTERWENQKNALYNQYYLASLNNILLKAEEGYDVDLERSLYITLNVLPKELQQKLLSVQEIGLLEITNPTNTQNRKELFESFILNKTDLVKTLKNLFDEQGKLYESFSLKYSDPKSSDADQSDFAPLDELEPQSQSDFGLSSRNPKTAKYVPSLASVSADEAQKHKNAQITTPSQSAPIPQAKITRDDDWVFIEDSNSSESPASTAKSTPQPETKAAPPKVSIWRSVTALFFQGDKEVAQVPPSSSLPRPAAAPAPQILTELNYHKLPKEFNISVDGSNEVGKSKLIHRYVENKYDENYISTLGREFNQKDISLPSKETIKIKLYEMNINKPRLEAKKSNSYDALVYCYNPAQTSIEEIKKFIDDVKQYSSCQFICIFETKTDETYSDEIMKNQQKIKEFANDEEIPYMQVSAKTGENVDNAFKQVINEYLIYDAKLLSSSYGQYKSPKPK